MTIQPFKETQTIKLSIHDEEGLQKSVDESVKLIEEYFDAIQTGEEHMFVGFICDGYFVSHFLEGNQVHLLLRAEIENVDKKDIEEFVKDIRSFGIKVRERVAATKNINAEMVMHEGLESFRLKLPEMIQAAMN